MASLCRSHDTLGDAVPAEEPARRGDERCAHDVPALGRHRQPVDQPVCEVADGLRADLEAGGGQPGALRNRRIYSNSLSR